MSCLYTITTDVAELLQSRQKLNIFLRFEQFIRGSCGSRGLPAASRRGTTPPYGKREHGSSDRRSQQDKIARAACRPPLRSAGTCTAKTCCFRQFVGRGLDPAAGTSRQARRSPHTARFSYRCRGGVYAAREHCGCPERSGPRKFAQRGTTPPYGVTGNGRPSRKTAYHPRPPRAACRPPLQPNGNWEFLFWIRNSRKDAQTACPGRFSFSFRFSPLFHRGIFGGLSVFLTIFPRFAQGFPHFQQSFPHFPRGKGGGYGGKPGANGAKPMVFPGFFLSVKNSSQQVHLLGP